MRLPAFVRLSVCLLARLLKTRTWIWMKCCVSTDVWTWTNLLTFEPYPDYSPNARTGLLSPISYKRSDTEFYVGKITRIRIGGPPLQRGVVLKVLKWFIDCAGGTPLSEVHALYRVPLSLCCIV